MTASEKQNLFSSSGDINIKTLERIRIGLKKQLVVPRDRKCASVRFLPNRIFVFKKCDNTTSILPWKFSSTLCLSGFVKSGNLPRARSNRKLHQVFKTVPMLSPLFQNKRFKFEMNVTLENTFRKVLSTFGRKVFYKF